MSLYKTINLNIMNNQYYIVEKMLKCKIYFLGLHKPEIEKL